MPKRKKTKKRKFNKPNWGSAVQRDAERQKQAASNYGFLKLPQGVPIFNIEGEKESRVKLDIMPYEVTLEDHPDRYDDEGIAMPGELWYKLPFKIHRNIGVENDSVVCPRSFGKPCPICEYREKRLKEGGDWKDEDIRELKASQRNLYVVIPIGSKEHEEIPHIWEISQFCFQKLLNQELAEDEDNAVFPDLEAGKTLKIRFDSKSFGKNSFAEASRIDFYDRKHLYEESILDDIPNLDECLEVFSYKELEAKFMEIDSDDMADEDIIEDNYEDEDEFEEEPAPKRKKKSVKYKKKSKPDPEPEEEFEEEEFEDEDEEEFEEEEFEEFEDDDEFLDEDLEDEFEEEFEDEESEPETKPTPKKKKKVKRVVKRKKKK